MKLKSPTVLQCLARTSPARVLLALIIATGTSHHSALGQSDATSQVAFEPVLTHLQFKRPLWMIEQPNTPGYVLIVEQRGRITRHLLDAEGSNTNIADATDTVALDLSGPKVRRRGNEEGMFALVFDPKFPESPYVYLHYSTSGPRRNVISRWTMHPDTGVIDPRSEHVILQVKQPWGNHNGGMIDFGPDGYLYISLGDGGAAGDPHNNGQDTSTLLGSILRIDVRAQSDNKPSADGRYHIPADNPLVGEPNARPELWAWGLRNVWRFAFDPKTSLMWGGDVGQNAFEEIDIIEGGKNYGWKLREGFAPFRGGQVKPEFVDPVVVYPRSEGVSVTGGYVYRGKAIKWMQGVYVYGDYQSGKVWGTWYDHENRKLIANRRIGHVPRPASFAVDRHGEIYVTSFDGRIYKMVDGSALLRNADQRRGNVAAKE